MTVEDLIEELRAMPPTAAVFVQVRRSISRNAEDYELTDESIEAVVYDLGRVSLRLEDC